MRSVVFAYHDVGYECVEALLAMGADIRAVFTHVDDPREEIWFRSVRELAETHGIDVFTPSRLSGEGWDSRLRALDVDFIFSFHYRRLLPVSLLKTAKRGALNLHTSLLPRYRGRCPVNWVLVHGETETGVTLHYMEEEADTGDIVAQKRVAISETEDARSLYAKVTRAAAALLTETYPLLCSGTARRVRQNEADATYYGGRTVEDGRIDWIQANRDVCNLVRAVTHPYPGAFTFFRGRKLVVWQARPVDVELGPGIAPGSLVASPGDMLVAAGHGTVRLCRVQWEGRPEESGAAFSRHVQLNRGDQLG